MDLIRDKTIKKIIGGILVVLVILNLIFFAIGKISISYFWIGVLLFYLLVRFIFKE